MLVALASLSVDAEVLEQVLVKVNGDIITKTELETRQVAAIRQRNRTNVSTDDLAAVADRARRARATASRWTCRRGL